MRKTSIVCVCLLLLFIAGCAGKAPDTNRMDEITPTTQDSPDSSTVEPEKEVMTNVEQGEDGQKNNKLEELVDRNDEIPVSDDVVTKNSDIPIPPLEQPESRATEDLDLSRYLHQNINEVIALFDNMHDKGATDGSVEYSNDVVTLCSGLGVDEIEFINICGECDYTLLGIKYGMQLSEAQTIADSLGELVSGGRQDILEYQLKTGNQFSIFSEDGFTVSDVSLFA